MGLKPMTSIVSQNMGEIASIGRFGLISIPDTRFKSLNDHHRRNENGLRLFPMRRAIVRDRMANPRIERNAFIRRYEICNYSSQKKEVADTESVIGW
jgi:hypothetical protein